MMEVEKYVKQRAQSALIKALEALDRDDYEGYIDELALAGRYLRIQLKKKHQWYQYLYYYLFGDTRNKKLTDNQNNYESTLYTNLSEQKLISGDIVKLINKNRKKIHDFNVAWREPGLGTTDKRHAALKKQLNMDTRHDVKLALLLIDTQYKKTIEKNKIVAKHDEEKISAAFNSYLTTRQKTLKYTAWTLAALYSLGFAVMVGGSFVATILLFAPAAPVPLLIAFFGVSFLNTLYVEWKLAKKKVPELLINLFGKDNLFDGLTHYIDDNGNKRTLSKTQKLGLAFGIIIGFGAAATNGILAYFGALQLPTVFPFLMHVSAYVPIFGFALAGVATLTMTALFLQDIAEMVRIPEDIKKQGEEPIKLSFKERIKLFFNKPFVVRKHILDERRAKLEESEYDKTAIDKEIQHLEASSKKFTIGFTALAVIGLIAVSIAGAVVLTGPFGLAVAIPSAILAFAGELPFVMSSVSKFSTKLAIRFKSNLKVNQKPDSICMTSMEKVDNVLFTTGGLWDGFTTSEEIYNTTSNVITAFHGAKSIVEGISSVAAGVATMGTGFMTSTELMSGDDVDPYLKLKDEAKAARLEKYGFFGTNNQKSFVDMKVDHNSSFPTNLYHEVIPSQ